MVSSSPDSAVLSEAGRKLSNRDTLGAIDLLQDWSEKHLVSQNVTDLLDFLQLPEATAVSPPKSDAIKSGASSRRLWSVRVEGEFQTDTQLPALGMLDLQRRFPLDAKTGSTDVLAGLSAGSWLEAAGPYAEMDLRTGIEFHRPTWNGRLEGWGGWTEKNQPEAGISGAWEFGARWCGWDLRQGPMARYSWRRARFLGWMVQGNGPVGGGELELDGTLRARQDPAWPAVLDYDTVPVRFARERAQATFHTALTKAYGSVRFGPQLDLDGRISFAPDRWTDSTEFTPQMGTRLPRSERRSELGCTASGFLRWEPSPVWFVEGSFGWTWAAQRVENGLDLSPFIHGPFLRLSARSNF